MKAFNLLLVLTLISAFYCRDCSGFAEKASICNQADFDLNLYYRCCFIEAAVSQSGSELTIRMCTPVTRALYNNVTALVDEATRKVREQITLDFKVSVDCTSNYINISILFLILLLL